MGKVYLRKLTYPEVIARIIVTFGKESPRMSCCTLVSSRRMMIMMICRMGYFPFENGIGAKLTHFCNLFLLFAEDSTIIVKPRQFRKELILKVD